MNKSIIYIMLFALVGLFSCEKTYIEENNDNYDYNSIKPKIFGISGTTATYASGLEALRYESNTIRGGSTYAWRVEGADATITPVEGEPYKADILFAQSGVAIDDVKVILKETTMGGLSTEDTLLVDLAPFCPKTIDWFVGTWSGVETDSKGNVTNVTISVEAVDATTVRAKADAIGNPPFLVAIYASWAETFQDGYGLNGDVLLNINLSTGAITLDEGTYWGQTLPGPYDYWYTGSGSWDGCTSNMTIDFNMYWGPDVSGDPNRSCQTVLTKN